MRGITFVWPGVSMSFVLMSDLFEVALGVHLSVKTSSSPYVSIVIMVSVWLSYVSCTKLSISFFSTYSSVTSSAQAP
jgi:hypothetical protein